MSDPAPRFRTGTHVALSASAGSGKTYALTLRLFKLLSDGVPAERILCTTFTNKATHEMAARLMSRIEEMARIDGFRPGDEPGEPEEALRNLYGGTGTLLPQERARAAQSARHLQARLLDRYARLNIVTMDSFFNTVLRLFPFESGVSPDFDIMNEAEEEGVFREAMNLFVEDLSASARAMELFEGLILSLSRTETDPQGLLKRYFDLLSAQRVEVENLMERRGKGDDLLDDALGLRRRSAESAAALVETCRQFGATAGPFSGTLAPLGKKMLNRCVTAASPRDVLKLTCFRSEQYADYVYFRRLPEEPSLSESFDRVRRAVRIHLEDASRFAVSTLLFFFRRYTEHADRIKRASRRLSFSDVSRKVFRLLVGSPTGAAADREFFYYRLDSRIQHLLMDEFQDTNVVQWSIFEPMITEITADREGSFFYVGDPKQAIYRFRGGESGLFRHVRSQLSERILDDVLPVNYRSSPTIVNFVNRVFAEIGAEDGYDFSPQQSSRTDEGYVEIQTVKDGSDETELDRTLVERIRGLLARGISPEGIGVLLRDNRSCARVADALTHAGVPAGTERRDSLFSLTSVRAAMGLLRFFADPSDEAGLLDFLSQRPDLLNPPHLQAVRQAPIGRRLDTLRRRAPWMVREFETLWNRIDRTPLEQILLTLLRVFRFGDCFGDRAHLLKWVQYAGETATRTGRTDLMPFLDHVHHFGEAEKQAADTPRNAVQVLTVHKAKGLEFEVVFLPQVEKPFTFNKQKSSFMIPLDNRFRLRDLHLTPARDELGHSPELDGVYRAEQDRTRIDALNLLYVALTRARTGLFILAPEPKKPDRAGRRPTSRSEGVVWLDKLLRAVEPESGDDNGNLRYASGSLSNLVGREPKGTTVPPDPGDAAPDGTAFSPDDSGSTSSRVHPSAGEGDDEPEAEDPAFRFVDPLRRHAALRYGEAFHLAMEHLVSKMNGDLAKRAALARFGVVLGPAERDRLEAAIDSVVADAAFRSLLSPGTLYTEIPVYLDKGGLLRVDLLVVAPGGVTVIDYKTRYLPETLPAYREQVRSYITALRSVFTDRPVSGRLVFVDQGVRIETVEEGVSEPSSSP